MLGSPQTNRALDDGLYDARSVSNFILDNFDAVRYDISNLKINKILYFVHGSFLGKFGIPFIRNHFEPWDFGPVVPVVYNEFKLHESRPIASRAMYLDPFSKKRMVVDHSNIDSRFLPFLLFITARYARVSAGKLVELTHKPGSPWSQARARVFTGTFSVGDRLRNDEIKAYFNAKNGLGNSMAAIDADCGTRQHWNKPRITFSGLNAVKIRN